MNDNHFDALLCQTLKSDVLPGDALNKALLTQCTRSTVMRTRNKKHLRVALIAATLVIIFTVSAFAAVQFGLFTEDKRDKIADPSEYSLSITPITNQESTLVYTGEPVILDVKFAGGKTPFDCGVMLMVDGIVAPFTINGNNDAKTMQNITLSNKAQNVTLTFTPQYVPAGKEVAVDILTVINPEFLLESLSYLSYYPQHRSQSLSCYKLRSEVDAGELSVSTELSNTKNLFNHSGGIGFQLSATPDPFAESKGYYTSDVGGKLPLWLSAYGNAGGKWRVSVYVNHLLQNAFDGKAYLDIELQEGKLLSKKITLDAPASNWNHVYLVAVPIERENEYATLVKSGSEIWLVADKSEIKAEESRAAKVVEDLMNTLGPDKETAVSLPKGAVSTFKFKLPKGTYLNGNIFTFENGDTIVSLYGEKTGQVLCSFNMFTGELGDENIPAFEKFKPKNKEEKEHLYRFNFWSEPPVDGLYYDNADITPISDGIIVYYRRSHNWQKYDTKLNLIDEGTLKLENIDKKKSHITYSAPVFNEDGTRFAYTVERGERPSEYDYTGYPMVVYIDNLEQSDRQEILTLADPNYENIKKGNLVHADILCYRDNLIFSGSTGGNQVSDGIEFDQVYGSISLTNGTISMIKDENPAGGMIHGAPAGRWYVICDSWKIDASPLSGTVRYWDAVTGKQSTFSFKNPNESNHAVLSENGKYIISFLEGGTHKGDVMQVRVYDLKSGKMVMDKKLNNLETSLFMKINEAADMAIISFNNKIVTVKLK